MRRLAPLFVVLAAMAGCNRGGSGSDGAVSQAENGLALSVSFDEPLRTGKAVTWTLNVENRRQEAVTLRFSSGKEGDVALRSGDREVYRWSANRVFSQALREVQVAARATHSVRLEESGMTVAPGEYDLVAEVAADPAPGVLHRPVTIR
ncbi:MAG TPA: BsuPI-related putative proteinase inhibitor [Acidimicrobiia bacterium]|nr:BsuPI-related putative proteinase inhibitor [Acidimicrobiia bacterium]